MKTTNLIEIEMINLISNDYTLDLKEFKQKQPLSYAFFCLDKCLNRSGMVLNFVNQDQNRVYFRVVNNINGKKSHIMDLSYTELLRMDIYTAHGIKEAVWGC